MSLSIEEIRELQAKRVQEREELKKRLNEIKCQIGQLQQSEGRAVYQADVPVQEDIENTTEPEYEEPEYEEPEYDLEEYGDEGYDDKGGCLCG